MSAVKLAKQMAAREHSVMFAARPDSRIIQELDTTAIGIIPLKLSGVLNINTIMRLHALIKTRKLQIIHCHRSGDLILFLVLSMFMNLPPVILDKQVSSKITKRDLYHRIIYRLVSKIFVLSKYLERNVLETCPVMPDKITVIPGGIRLDDYIRSNDSRERIRKEWGIDSTCVVIGCVSRIDEQKGLMDVVNAFSMLSKNDPQLRLVFVGEPTVGEPAFAEKLHRQIGELKISREIIFAGYRADIPRVLSAFDLFILPSYEESFGYVFIEAMAAGLPVIATNAGGVPEIVEDGTTGILVSPRNQSEIFKAMEKLTRDEILRLKFGRAGRRRVEMYFLESKIIERIEGEYNSLLNSK